MPVFVVSPADLSASILRDHDEVKKQMVDEIRTTVKLHGPRIAQALIGAERPPPVDRGTYRRSFKTSDIADGVTMYNFAPHAPIIEDGRRPGSKMPPVGAIFEWARRKGIGTRSGPSGRLKGQRLSRRPGDSALRGIAFVIARRIAQRGLPAHRILARTVEELEPLVDKKIDEVLGRI